MGILQDKICEVIQLLELKWQLSAFGLFSRHLTKLVIYFSIDASFPLLEFIIVIKKLSINGKLTISVPE